MQPDNLAASLAALREAMEKATGGPWKRAFEGECEVVRGESMGLRPRVCDVLWRNDADFIALAKNTLPAFLADVERVIAERDALRAELSRKTERHGNVGQYTIDRLAEWGDADCETCGKVMPCLIRRTPERAVLVCHACGKTVAKIGEALASPDEPKGDADAE